MSSLLRRSRRHRIKVNHHVHTRASDGCDSAEDIVRSAQKHNMILGITDHNTVDGLRELDDLEQRNEVFGSKIRKHVLPGIEIQSRSCAEVLVYASSIRQMISFFDEIIRPKLSLISPKYDPINLHMPELIERCIERGMYFVIPHFSLRSYGWKGLPKDQLKKCTHLFRSHRGRIAVEHNPHMFAWQNSQASLFAMKNRLPVIAGADSHDSIHHRSFTSVRLPKNFSSLTEAFFSAIYQKRPRVNTRHIEMMSKVRSIKHGCLLMRNMGWEGISSTVRKRSEYS